jgi:hypothetical protein
MHGLSDFRSLLWHIDFHKTRWYIFKICLEQFLTSSQNLHFLAVYAVFSTVSGWRKAQLAYIVAIETYPF